MVIKKLLVSLRKIIARARQLLTNPHPLIQEEGERQRAQLLAIITLVVAVLLFVSVLSTVPSVDASVILLVTVALTSYGLSRSRYYSVGIYLFAYGFTSLAYLPFFLGTSGDFEANITTTAYVSIVLASVLMPARSFVILVILSIIATFAAPFYSRISVPIDGDFFRISGIHMTIGFVLIGGIVFRDRIEQNRLKKAQEINTQLENLTADIRQRSLELEKVNEQTSRRAAQLQAITELSETIAEVQDLNTLFPIVTNLISERFGFYHVGIFLVDSNREFAILQAANSEGGQRMLGRGHRLRLGTGVVGYAAQSGEPRIALDVGADAVFFNNPDLPDTHSEAALPLNSRGETIGILDVQSTEPGAFSTEDLRVLTALANQVSIAFENTRLLTEARASLTQVEEVYNEFTRAEWSRAAAHVEQAGFRYHAGRIEILENELRTPEVVSAVQNGRAVTNQPNGSNEKQTMVAVPVKLRGEVIGVLHIESNDPSREWQEDEISLVEAVAERAAIAMENSRLFQDARRRAAKEQLISEASARIGSAFNLENILQTTAEELERVLGGSEILIQFQNKEAV